MSQTTRTGSSDRSGVAVLSQHELERAAGYLRSGSLVAFPTDTFFALGAVLTDAAISSLIEVKGRSSGNPVPVLLSSADQVQDVATSFSATAAALAQAFWPGPLTLVLPARTGLPAPVTAGTGSVGVRVPDHPLARELIALVGQPLTGTSANISGEQPCKTANDVLRQLDGRISAVIDARCGEHAEPSTVVRLSEDNDNDNEIQVVRAGAISELELRRVLDEA